MRLNYIDNIDCLEGLAALPDKSVDLIVTDPPYGTTRNPWDNKVPLDQLWEALTRVIKEDGAILIFSDGLFMAELMLSAPKLWRYNLVWDKVLTSGFLNANRMPLRQTEEICVFYKKAPTYHPQKSKGKKNHTKGKPAEYANNNYGSFNFQDNAEELGDMKHPTSLVSFAKPHPSVAVHPTQKPVGLLEYLIKTYSDPGDTVLDPFMGSGTTAEACIRTGRHYIGFELSAEYCEIAKQRIGATVDETLAEVTT